MSLASEQVEGQLSYLLRAWLVECLEGPKDQWLSGAFDALFGHDPKEIARVLDGLKAPLAGPGSALLGEMLAEEGIAHD